jgi:hypothetical protein
MNLKITRLGRIGIAAILIFAGVIAFRALSQDQHSLLRVATPVASTQDWTAPDPSMHNFLPYFWLPDRSVLFFRRGDSGGYRAYRQHITEEGRAEPPHPLPMPEVGAKYRIQSLSSDGKWLYVTLWKGPGNIIPEAHALDGSKTVVWPRKFSVAMNWSPDSSSLIQMAWAGVGWSVAELRLDSPRQRWRKLNSVQIPSTERPTPVGFAADGRMVSLLDRISNVPATTQRLALVDLAHTASATQISNVTLPVAVWNAGLQISPDGNHMLWTCTSDITSPFAKWMGRLHLSSAKSEMGQSWWVSRLDGSGMHEIGHISARQDDGGVALRWLPDSRHCSFVYKGKLYVLPTD